MRTPHRRAYSCEREEERERASVVVPRCGERVSWQPCCTLVSVCVYECACACACERDREKGLLSLSKGVRCVPACVAAAHAYLHTHAGELWARQLQVRVLEHADADRTAASGTLTRTHKHTQAYTQRETHTQSSYMDTQIHTYTHTHTYARICTYTHIRTLVHAHTHIYTYIRS
jgi:hypothetical protein